MTEGRLSYGSATHPEAKSIFSIGGCEMTKNVGALGRRTEHIGRRVTQSILRAFDFAHEIGRPLNCYVVVHLRETEQQSATSAFKMIRHRYRDWLNYKAKKVGQTLSPDYIYALENPDGDMPHVNWALHVPSEYRDEFQKKLTRWVEKVQGPVRPFDIDIQAIKPSHAKRLAKYICKGTQEDFIAHFFLEGVAAPQGEIWGKRAGVSPSIGTSVRREAGFRPRRGRSANFYAHPAERASSRL